LIGFIRWNRARMSSFWNVSFPAMALDPVMYNTIFDAVHATTVAEETELRLRGLTVPSDDA
jgi:hypothetical protein